MYSSIVLSIFTLLHNRSTELFKKSFYIETVCPLDNFSFPLSPSLWQTPLCKTFMIWLLPCSFIFFLTHLETLSAGTHTVFPFPIHILTSTLFPLVGTIVPPPLIWLTSNSTFRYKLIRLLDWEMYTYYVLL